MKKILLLGGAHSQIPSIKKARELGYYTITCDYLPNNPGHAFAHEYHNVSTTDKEAVLALAQKLKIDGIVAYASDPAAPTAAYVAEKMGLPGHPYKAVEILSHKDLFRHFLAENGFNAPRAQGFSRVEDALADWDNFKKPVMIKPVDSSASKGVVEVRTKEELKNSFPYSISFSRCGRVVVEEFIESAMEIIHGDAFSVDGKLAFCCMGEQFFWPTLANPYAPIYTLWPHRMPQNLYQELYDTLQRLIKRLDMGTGAYNIEARFDAKGDLYLIEVGPRCGGNWVPEAIQVSTGTDLTEYIIKGAMGEDCSQLRNIFPSTYSANYILRPGTRGIFKGIEIDQEIKENIVSFHQIVNFGTEVDVMIPARAVLGVMILHFTDVDDANKKLSNIKNYIRIIIE